MKKVRNLVIGGIENKVFNLILAAVLLTAVVFMSGFMKRFRAAAIWLIPFPAPCPVWEPGWKL